MFLSEKVERRQELGTEMKIATVEVAASPKHAVLLSALKNKWVLQCRTKMKSQ
jgi:hypothetical protein